MLTQKYSKMYATENKGRPYKNGDSVTTRKIGDRDKSMYRLEK